MNRRVTLLVAVAAAAGFTMSACATPVGYVQGRATGFGGPSISPNGPPFHPMMGAQVVFTQDGKTVSATTTRADGSYSLALVPGNYTATGPCGSLFVNVSPNVVASLNFDCPIP